MKTECSERLRDLGGEIWVLALASGAGRCKMHLTPSRTLHPQTSVACAYVHVHAHQMCMCSMLCECSR